MKEKKGFINLQLFAEATNGAGTAATATNETGTWSSESVDYKALYEQEKTQREKFKVALDKSNSENAEYKRREREKLSKEELEAADRKAKDEELAQLRQEVARSKAERIFAEANISHEVYDDILDTYVPVLGVEQIGVLTDKIAKAIKKSVDSALELSKNKTVQTGTVLPKGGETSNPELSFIKDLAKQSTQTQSEKIKEFYK